MTRFAVTMIAITGCLALAAPDAEARGRQAPETFAFELDDGNTMTTYLYGTSERRPLVILVHGASDTHAVFDQAPGWSSARALARRGFGVLAVDRVGYGQSSHPDGDTLDFATQAAHLDEVVQAARGGALGFTPPEIVTLGPSLGADIAITHAGTYGGVDGVIVVSHTSQLQPELFEVDVNEWFAQGDYFDFGAEFRRRFFYAEPWAVEWMIALDNATRALVPRAEIGDALAAASAPLRDDIDVPVLLLQAESDGLFVPRDDSNLFTSSPDVTFRLLRNAGHKSFSHPTSKNVAVVVVSRWLRRHL